MTVSELGAWAIEKQVEWAKGFAVDVRDETPWSYMLKLIADWQAMRTALLLDEQVPESAGLAVATLRELRLKP